MGTVALFEQLQRLDALCRINDRGLPAEKKVVENWVGVGFRINNISLITKMEDIAEILPPPDTSRVPGVKDWVVGLANVRGSLMPVLDMKAFLFGEATVFSKQSRVLVIKKLGMITSLLVEEVYGLRRFNPELMKENIDESVGEISEYLAGTVNEQMNKWNIFSVEKLVKDEKFIRVV